MNATTNRSGKNYFIQHQNDTFKQRYRVELITATVLRPEDNMMVLEVLAKDSQEAISLAVELLQKEYPTTPWVKIEPWFVERVGIE